MFNFYFNIGLIYLIIGFFVAMLFSFVLKKRFFGNFWGALLVAVIGAFLGGIVEFFFEDTIHRLTQVAGSVNVFPPLITSFVLIWIFSKVNVK